MDVGAGGVLQQVIELIISQHTWFFQVIIELIISQYTWIFQVIIELIILPVHMVLPGNT